MRKDCGEGMDHNTEVTKVRQEQAGNVNHGQSKAHMSMGGCHQTTNHQV